MHSRYQAKEGAKVVAAYVSLTSTGGDGGRDEFAQCPDSFTKKNYFQSILEAKTKTEANS